MGKPNWVLNKKADETVEILLYDAIGPAYYGLISAKEVVDQLKAAGDVKAISLRINSPGGDVFEGFTIYNALKNHAATVAIAIDGMAASIASIISMAGDTIEIAENAMVMIHDPSSYAFGGAEEMRKQADLLDKIKEQCVEVYAARTGMDKEKLAEMMAAETWFTGQEAVDNGFANTLSPNKSISAAFDGTRFRNAPQWAQDRIKATVQPETESGDKVPETEAESPWRRNLAKRRLEVAGTLG
jgi:ATP-dependent Clp endopeptidase proteolytic subunit ClpP